LPAATIASRCAGCTISPGGNLHRDHLQRALLETEQVHFDGAGRIDLARFGWRLPREVD
jgi:alkylated DNA nucleotide flippase Atl1